MRPASGTQLPHGQCPPTLANQLAINGLVPDEQTDRIGNCGVDAFVRSLLNQPKLPHRSGQSQAGKNRTMLQRSRAKAALARQVGVKWLADHGGDAIWEGMTIALLCETVSSTGFREYLTQMGRDGAWIDTAFLHGLGCAYEVDVMIFQTGMEPALVGISLLDMGDSQGRYTHVESVSVLIHATHNYLLIKAPEFQMGLSYRKLGYMTPKLLKYLGSLYSSTP